MKTLINIITLIVLTTSLAKGQTTDSIIQKLIDKHLMTQKETASFQIHLKQGYPGHKATYLHALAEINIYNSNKRERDYLLQGQKTDSLEQIKINEELILYLPSLKSCDLINDKLLKIFSTQINNNKFSTKVKLLFAIEAMVEQQDLMAPSKAKIFAKLLKEQAIVSTQYEQLLSDIEQDKLENPIEFINYCDKAVIIKKEDFPDEPEKYLELIHRKTANIIPELNFTDFEFKIMLDSANSHKDYKHYEFLISIKLNGKIYKQKSTYYRFAKYWGSEYYRNKIEEKVYYNIFNKILADIQSPYRLHLIEGFESPPLDKTTFGIIALTQEQEKSLHKGSIHFFPSDENFNQNVTNQRIEEAIEAYQKIGLVAHLNSEQIKEAKKKITLQENYTLNNTLGAFPDVIYTTNTTQSNIKKTYTELIQACRAISHNKFNASKISYNFKINRYKPTILRFKLGVNTYRKAVSAGFYWMHEQFFDFIKAITIENNLEGQFYEVYTDKQEVSLIYLTQEQYEYLKSNQLLVFGNDIKVDKEEY